MNFLARVLKPLFWAALIFSYVAAVMPQAEAPRIADSDKVEHMIAFFTLSLLAGLAWRHVALLWIGVALASFGLLIELTQAVPLLHRDASGADWAADCAAILVGLAVAFAGRRSLPWPRT